MYPFLTFQEKRTQSPDFHAGLIDQGQYLPNQGVVGLEITEDQTRVQDTRAEIFCVLFTTG